MNSRTSTDSKISISHRVETRRDRVARRARLGAALIASHGAVAALVAVVVA